MPSEATRRPFWKADGKVRLDRHDGRVNPNGHPATLVPAPPGNLRTMKSGVYSAGGRALAPRADEVAAERGGTEIVDVSLGAAAAADESECLSVFFSAQVRR